MRLTQMYGNGTRHSRITRMTSDLLTQWTLQFWLRVGQVNRLNSALTGSMQS